MAAEKTFSNRSLRSERGQSVIEFLFALPVMFIFTVMLIKINTVIQVSLVNQKYARAQAHFLAYNSPYFPTLDLRELHLVAQGANQMIIGVSENSTMASGGGKTKPDPTVVTITRRGVSGSDERATPRERSKVRVRTSVAMCTQQGVLSDGSPVLPLTYDGAKWLAAKPSQLGDKVNFEPCRSNSQ